jgi:hypothetical protein
MAKKDPNDTGDGRTPHAIYPDINITAVDEASPVLRAQHIEMFPKLKELSRRDATVNYSVQHYILGEVDFETMLLGLVEILAKEKAIYFSQIVEYTQLSVAPSINLGERNGQT